MKLLFCQDCHDVFSLRQGREKACECGKSSGKYIDDLNAEISGRGVPLGFANSSFLHALANRPEAGTGTRFEAFVIPKVCPTVVQLASQEND